MNIYISVLTNPNNTTAYEYEIADMSCYSGGNVLGYVKFYDSYIQIRNYQVDQDALYYIILG